MKQNPEGEILTTISGQIGWLTIANPLNRNAMNLAMYQQIPSAIDELVNAKIRVVIVQGHGGEAFGAGSDISEFETLRTPDNAGTYDDAEADAHEAIENAPVPTIAMVKGPCRGGGLAIALACDLRYASEEATFAAPPAKLGIAFPHPAVESLVNAIGDTHARHLLLTATTIDAQEAYRIGLVHRVMNASILETEVVSIATGICKLAPNSLTAAKTSLANLKGHTTRQQVQDAIAACYESQDYQEGIKAFMNKRAPNFDGM
tara:strand:+ start:568 stop:1350 length:783 start_codon:yes stop_codon:yes gene_type:complete